MNEATQSDSTPIPRVSMLAYSASFCAPRLSALNSFLYRLAGEIRQTVETEKAKAAAGEACIDDTGLLLGWAEELDLIGQIVFQESNELHGAIQLDAKAA